MQQFKEYTGSVYGGLGHLLMCYYQAKKLPIPEKLHQIQNLERFDYALWRDLLKHFGATITTTCFGSGNCQIPCSPNI